MSPATVIGTENRGEATEGIGTSVLRPPVLRTVRSPIGGVDDAEYSVYVFGVAFFDRTAYFVSCIAFGLKDG